eukprot:scaffold4239_cov38-Prasinocladus_malaysianus.AAC.1
MPLPKGTGRAACLARVICHQPLLLDDRKSKSDAVASLYLSEVLCVVCCCCLAVGPLCDRAGDLRAAVAQLQQPREASLPLHQLNGLPDANERGQPWQQPSVLVYLFCPKTNKC